MTVARNMELDWFKDSQFTHLKERMQIGLFLLHRTCKLDMFTVHAWGCCRHFEVINF